MSYMGKVRPTIALLTDDIADDQVTSAKIADTTIVDADVNASAAIAKTKLASLDVVNADVNASAAIVQSKLATLAIDTAELADNGVTLGKLEDGTQGDILYYGASGAPSRLGFGTSGDFLKTQGTGANPVWSTVSSATIQYFNSTIIASTSDTSTSATFISGGANVTVPSATANTLSKIIVMGSGQARFDGPASANMMKWRIERTAPSSVTSNVVTIGGAIGTGTEQYHTYFVFYVDESLSDADHTYEVQFKKDYASTVYYKHGGTNIWVYGV